MYIYIQTEHDRNIYTYNIYIHTHTQMDAVVIVCMCVQVRFTETNSQKWCMRPTQQDSLGIPAHQYGALWLKASLRAAQSQTPLNHGKEPIFGHWETHLFPSTSRCLKVWAKRWGLGRVLHHSSRSKFSLILCRQQHKWRQIHLLHMQTMSFQQAVPFDHQTFARFGTHFRGSKFDNLATSIGTHCHLYLGPTLQLL